MSFLLKKKNTLNLGFFCLYVKERTVVLVLSYFYILSSTCYRFERVWDPTLVQGAQQRISYFFLKAVRKPLLSLTFSFLTFLI